MDENQIENENNQNVDNNEQTVDYTSQINELTTKLNEALSVNEKLSREKDDFFNEMKTVKGKLKEYTSAAQDEEEKNLFKQGEEGFKAVLDNRVKAATSQFEETILNLNNEKSSLSEKVTQLENIIKVNEVKGNLLEVVKNVDIEKTAINDFVNFAMQDGELKNGKWQFRDQNGNIKTVNSKGQPYSINDYIAEQRQIRPYLFEKVNGTDAQPNGANNKSEISGSELRQLIQSGDKEKYQKTMEDIKSGKISLIN